MDAKIELQNKAKETRDLIVEAGYKNKSSHIGSCMSCVEILTYLYFNRMQKNDIFILSKGHAALALYSVLYLKGNILKEELLSYPKTLGCHVPFRPKLGLYAATGSLGHGICLAMGYAIARPGINVYVLCGDGERNEGSYMEAMNFRPFPKNLFVYVDFNGLSGFMKQEVPVMPVIDGHSFDELIKTKTNTVFCKTVKGKGIKRFENRLESHYWNITDEDLTEYKK